MARLGEICKFQSGGTPSKGEASYFNGNIPWITTVALNGKSINEKSAVDWITEKAIEKSAAKIVPANSVMVGTRVGVGKVAINEIAMSTSQDIISLIEIDESKWSKSFICKFIQGKGSFLNSQARGATIKGIKIETLAGLQLPDITLEEQNRVADVLDIVENLISLRKEQLAKLDELVKARFVEMFGDPIENVMQWHATDLNQVCTKITDGEHGSVSRTTSGHYFLNAKHVKKDGTIDWITATHVDNEIHKKIYARCNPEPGDILLTTTGTIGNVAIVPNVEPFSMDRGITLLKLNKEIIDKDFLSVLLNFECILNVMKSNVHASAIGHLFLNQVMRIPVIVPPIKVQSQFSTFVEQTNKTKLTIQSSLDKLEVMKKALMQEYFG